MNLGVQFSKIKVHKLILDHTDQRCLSRQKIGQISVILLGKPNVETLTVNQADSEGPAPYIAIKKVMPQNRDAKKQNAPATSHGYRAIPFSLADDWLDFESW